MNLDPRIQIKDVKTTTHVDANHTHGQLDDITLAHLQPLYGSFIWTEIRQHVQTPCRADYGERYSQTETRT